VLVRGVHIDRDAALGEALRDGAPPRDGPLLHLEAGPGVGVRRGLLREVGVEVPSGQVQGGVAHHFDFCGALSLSGNGDGDRSHSGRAGEPFFGRDARARASL
jgi:hypothetical protein